MYIPHHGYQILSLCFSLCEKYPFTELGWSAFSRIRTEYGDILRISPYLVQMPENTDQNNSEYGHSLRSVYNSPCDFFSQKFDSKAIVYSYLTTKVYSEYCETSKMKLFAKMINDLIIFARSSVLDV